MDVLAPKSNRQTMGCKPVDSGDRSLLALGLKHGAASQFRQRGKEMVDWICDYYSGVGDRPVRSSVEVGYYALLVAAHLPDTPVLAPANASDPACFCSISTDRPLEPWKQAQHGAKSL